MSWDAYLTSMNQAANGVTNALEHAGLYLFENGAPYAQTAGFGLQNYNIEIPTDDETSVENVAVNEFNNLKEIFERNGPPTSRAGIRINNEKYYFSGMNQETGAVYLKKQGGGACLARSLTLLLVGTWKGEIELSSGNGTQNAGLCNGSVERIAEYLKGLNI